MSWTASICRGKSTFQVLFQVTFKVLHPPREGPIPSPVRRPQTPVRDSTLLTGTEGEGRPSHRGRRVLTLTWGRLAASWQRLWQQRSALARSLLSSEERAPLSSCEREPHLVLVPLNGTRTGAQFLPQPAECQDPWQSPHIQARLQVGTSPTRLTLPKTLTDMV